MTLPSWFAAAFPEEYACASDLDIAPQHMGDESESDSESEPSDDDEASDEDRDVAV